MHAASKCRGYKSMLVPSTVPLVVARGVLVAIVQHFAVDQERSSCRRWLEQTKSHCQLGSSYAPSLHFLTLAEPTLVANGAWLTKDFFSVYCYMYLAILLSTREANTAGGNTYLKRMRRMQKLSFWIWLNLQRPDSAGAVCTSLFTGWESIWVPLDHRRKLPAQQGVPVFVVSVLTISILCLLHGMHTQFSSPWHSNDMHGLPAAKW